MKGKKEEQRDSEMKGRDDRWVQMSLLSAEEQLMPGREIKLMHLWLDVFVLQPLTPAGRSQVHSLHQREALCTQ